MLLAAEDDRNKIAASVCCKFCLRALVIAQLEVDIFNPAFLADVRSHIADSPSFTSWVQEKDVLESLQSCLEKLPLQACSLSVRSRYLLDTSGTALWNVCSRACRNMEGVDVKDELSNAFCQGIRLLIRHVHKLIIIGLVQLLSCLVLESCFMEDESEERMGSFVFSCEHDGLWLIELTDSLKSLHILLKCANVCLGTRRYLFIYLLRSHFRGTDAKRVEYASTVVERATMRVVAFQTRSYDANKTEAIDNLLGRYHLTCAILVGITLL
jgi:hypothetical protein